MLRKDAAYVACVAILREIVMLKMLSIGTIIPRLSSWAASSLVRVASSSRLSGSNITAFGVTSNNPFTSP